ncbi:acyltransferase [Methanobrevibacter sp.]|uniref:acyltransferase n=1 Tax=Methanobrevibacter sp. TaxID=66852 RepID=UPI0025CC5563|nr:acyltransferase [Methanobrevibacter sp.]MBR4447966.1 acyltransferase [Methanobrevibacter sp.]
MNQSKRIFYYDVLRALAIIGIVFCHASIVFVLTGINNPDFYISAFFDCFREFSIPVFVMLSGALLINKKDSLKTFFKKRLSRIFIPFLFWVVIYIVYSSLFVTHGFDLSYSIDVFFGTSSTLGVAFWFIWMITIAYILIFIINQTISFGLKKDDAFDKKFINFLTIISLIYFVIVQFHLFNPYPSKITYFISFMAYIIIGYFIANNNYLESKIPANRLAIITGILFIATYLYYIFGYVVPMSQSHNHFTALGYFNLTILFMSVNFFLMFKFLSKANYMDNLENNSLGKAFTYISNYSFGIYLAHYMILHCLKNNLLNLTDYTQQSPLFWIPLFVVLTLIISLLILSILNKIPYLKRVSGNN